MAGFVSPFASQHELAEGKRMKEQQVTHILQKFVEQEVPADLDLWPAIQAQLQPQRSPSGWVRLMPTTRLGWVFLALALCLAIGAGTWAVGSAVNRLFQVDPGLNHVRQAGLGQELDLSQTVDGVTVTLERAYADANRVVVGFTMIGPDGQRYGPHPVTLTDAAGTVFPGSMGMGVTGKSERLQVDLPPGTGSYVYFFDASAVEGVPTELDLHLVIEVEEFVLPLFAPDPVSTPDDPPAEPLDSTVVEVQPIHQEGAVVGPFIFDFSVPFTPDRAVVEAQTVKAAGVAVTLEEVVVTPSATRATLCFAPPDDEWDVWVPIATLDTGKAEYGGGLDEIGEKICHTHTFHVPLYDQRGEWTLTVTELVGMIAAPPGEQTRLAGPWVFRFRVP
jgi:hypothetical protein